MDDKQAKAIEINAALGKVGFELNRISDLLDDDDNFIGGVLHAAGVTIIEAQECLAAGAEFEGE